MSDEKRGPGRPRKKLKPLVNTPAQFEADPELGLTEMQAAFVWFYTEGSCGQTAERGEERGSHSLLRVPPR